MAMVKFEDIVEGYGWVNRGAFCGPTVAGLKANHTQHMHEILRALRDKCAIPDKIANKWLFPEGSDAVTLASQELHTYMDHAQKGEHNDYMKQFRKKHSLATFSINVKTLDGKSMTLLVKGDDTVSDLKTMIETKDGQTRDDSYLEYPKGKNKLKDSRILQDYNISKDCTVWEMGRLRGGAREAPTTEDNIESNRNLITLIDRTLVYRLSRIELN